MKVFDLKSMKTYSHDERDKNVFYKTNEFKTRIIELPPEGKMPECKMESYVIFNFIEGEAEVTVDNKTVTIKEGQCLILEPATLSMVTKTGVKIMGTQIDKK